MIPIFQLDSTILNSGVYPDMDTDTTPLWLDSRNVYATNDGLQAILGAEEIYDFGVEITGIAQASVSLESRIYVATKNEAWKWNADAVEKIATGMQSGHHRIVTWGSWVLINSGLEFPWLWKNEGLAQQIENLPFAWAKHFKKRGPHMLAFNTNFSPQQMFWCSADDVENWDYTNPIYTAGELTMRDLDGPIKCATELADNLALYSEETLAICQYIGQSFIFGAMPVLSGIGAWGHHAVCSANDRNFGFGPQGLFETNGSSFRYLGDQWVKKFILDNIDVSQAEHCMAWFNEPMSVVQFCFPKKGGGTLCIAWDYAREVPWIFDKETGHVTERQVFLWPVGSVGNKLCFYSKGQNWVGEPIGGYLQSKMSHFGDPFHSKTLQMVEVKGNLGTLGLTVRGASEARSTPHLIHETMLQVHNWMEIDAEYVDLRLEFGANTGWKVNGINGYGRKSGRLG